MKKILITIFCASLILVTPLSGVAQDNKISNILFEQPGIDGLVYQLRVVIDEILEKYGHIPMVRALCNVILNSLGLIGLILYCIIFFIIAILLGLVFLIFAIMGLYYVPSLIAQIVFIILMDLIYYCNEPIINLKIPIISLYKTLETNKIIKLIKDCPCLYE